MIWKWRWRIAVMMMMMTVTVTNDDEMMIIETMMLQLLRMSTVDAGQRPPQRRRTARAENASLTSAFRQGWEDAERADDVSAEQSGGKAGDVERGMVGAVKVTPIESKTGNGVVNTWKGWRR
jgi:hypothetical protein